MLIGKVPKHFCPSFCSWVSLIPGITYVSPLFSEQAQGCSLLPSSQYILVYFCISCLPWEPGPSIDKQLLTAIIHGLLWCIYKIIGLSAFETLTGSFSAVTIGRVSRRLHKDVNIPGFLSQPCCVWHRRCPVQQGSVCYRQSFSHTTVTWPFPQLPAVLSCGLDTGVCWAQLICLNSDWQEAPAEEMLQWPYSRRKAGLSCWPGHSVRGAPPGGQT